MDAGPAPDNSGGHERHAAEGINLTRECSTSAVYGQLQRGHADTAASVQLLARICTKQARLDRPGHVPPPACARVRVSHLLPEIAGSRGRTARRSAHVGRWQRPAASLSPRTAAGPPDGAG